MNTSLPTQNILIIDDDPVARMLAKRNLEIAGFLGSISSAENGQDGYNIISKSDKEYIVLLDFHMPELDGVGLLRKLKSNQLNPPVFMLSSSILSENMDSCLSHECVQQYFIKPIDQLKSKVILEYATEQVTV